MKALFKHRISVALILFYAAGIFIGTLYDTDTLLISATCVLAILFIIFFIRKRKFNYPSMIACVLIFMLGVVFINHNIHNRHKDLRSFYDVKGVVYGTVVSQPKLTSKENHHSFTVEVHKIEVEEKTTPVSGKIIVYLARNKTPVPKINDNIHFATTLLKPDYTDGNFVYEEYLRTKDIYATGFTYIVYPDSKDAYDLTFVDKLNYVGREINIFLQGRIETVFADDPDTCALLKGILLGEKSDFTKEMTQNMSLAGFSHIAAVSGLHLNILFGALCGFLGFLRVRKKIVAALSLPVILIFAAVTGFSPSVCRAAIMLSLFIGALIFKRQYDSITALFISAFVILTANPFALFNISFILSFASTLAIILLYKPINKIFVPLEKKSKILKAIFSSIAISVAAFIGTTPFVAYYFGVVSISSLVANIWIVPLCGPIFVLGYVLCGTVGFLPDFICTIFAKLLSLCAKIVLKTADIFAALPFTHWEVPEFPGYYILIYFIVLFAIYLVINKILHRR